MQGINSVTLVGNIGADPELRYTNGGKAVCDLRIAVDRPADDGKTFTSWHSVTVWGKPAEEVAQLGKGAAVIVIGREQTESWEDKKSGEKRYKTIVTAEVIGRVCFGEHAAQRQEAPRQEQRPPQDQAGHFGNRDQRPAQPRGGQPPRGQAPRGAPAPATRGGW